MSTVHTNRDQFLLDVFTTALEGGIGYWSECSEYHWHDDSAHDADYLGFFAFVIEVEADGEPVHVIDRSTIARGLELAAGRYRHSFPWSVEPPPMVITHNTDWDFDADDADAVVQLGLFQEVIYG